MFPEYIFWIFTGTIIVLSALTLGWLLNPMRRTGAYKPTCQEIMTTPKVSVIVYSQVPEDRLTSYLDSLSSQDYPDFEVIVICESTAESNEILSESCARRYHNVYVTFIPPGSHNLSRRKLALTLGMKAAKGEVVVTTVSNACIHSTSWLSALIMPFRTGNADSTDISLGYTHMNYHQMKGWGKWYREFNSIVTNAQWIGYALANRPYRGDGYNLAFRRALFFEHKGYSQSIYLHPGDDDIFISEVATPSNTRMILDPDSILTIEWEEASTRMWRSRKEQYDFTSRWLPRGPFIKAGAVSLMQWLILILSAVTALLPSAGYILHKSILTISDIVLASIAPAVLVIFWLCEIIIYRRAASKMEGVRLWWSLPLFWLAKPVLNRIFRFRHRRHRRHNYTWLRN